jgi:hypothetical protein
MKVNGNKYMKVVCINNMELGRDSNGKSRLNRLPLTIGKVYDTVLDGEIQVSNVRFYMLEKDNNDETYHYAAQYFVTLDVWREQQLNKLI